MKLNGIIKYYTCDNTATIPNTAFVTLSPFSVAEIERLSRLLSMSATNIPPILPQSAVASTSFRDSSSVPFQGSTVQEKFLNPWR